VREEVKQGTNSGTTGFGNFFNKLGFGEGAAAAKKEKNYTTCLKHMETFRGKNVIMTGATGAVGEKVAKKLIKAGIYFIYIDST
jgi:aspartate-semialdehyde dehydrogenase